MHFACQILVLEGHTESSLKALKTKTHLIVVIAMDCEQRSVFIIQLFFEIIFLFPELFGFILKPPFTTLQTSRHHGSP